jgi:hypothetical protein
MSEIPTLSHQSTELVSAMMIFIPWIALGLILTLAVIRSSLSLLLQGVIVTSISFMIGIGSVVLFFENTDRLVPALWVLGIAYVLFLFMMYLTTRS